MGGWAAVAMIIAFVMMQAQATTFSEAAAMPTAGSADYLSCGPAALAITGTISAYFLVHVRARRRS